LVDKARQYGSGNGDELIESFEKNILYHGGNTDPANIYSITGSTNIHPNAGKIVY